MRVRNHALRLVCLVLLVGGLALLGSLAALLRAPLSVQAQTQTPPDLVVTLRDGVDAGIVGATITVHDHDGEGVLAQAQTDIRGTATITTVLMTDVRVAITGKASNGASLKQLDSDTGGIALFLDGARTTQLDLRVEDDGTVIPDPREMIVPETVPTTAAAPVLTVVAPVGSGVVATMQPTTSLLVMASPVPASAVAPTSSHESFSLSKLVVSTVLSMVVVAVLIQLGMRMWRERRSQ